MDDLKNDLLNWTIYSSRAEMGLEAGKAVEAAIAEQLSKKEELRMVFAAAPSQQEVLHYLVSSQKIDWQKISVFHMDEYIGVSSKESYSFAGFLKRSLFDAVKPRQVHLINGACADVQEECQRYAKLLGESDIDIVCLGVGENGHLAFNDPPVADFNDPLLVKVVTLDESCRQQQVNDGCFPSLDAVPKQAITLTIPALLAAEQLFCVVPGKTKAQAVAQLLQGEISTKCPASILRRTTGCQLYLDPQSASLLSL